MLDNEKRRPRYLVFGCKHLAFGSGDVHHTEAHLAGLHLGCQLVVYHSPRFGLYGIAGLATLLTMEIEDFYVCGRLPVGRLYLR